MDNMDQNNGKCSFKQGALPGCAPLAAAFVPMQQETPPRYSAADALPRGTLFPGLDLPFKNTANSSTIGGNPELTELMAMGFALDELGLYLDTHRNDSEAFALFKTCAQQYKTARDKYVEEHGPQKQLDAALDKCYTWLNDPWPWERSAN